MGMKHEAFLKASSKAIYCFWIKSCSGENVWKIFRRKSCQIL